MLQKYALKVETFETFETKFELLTFSSGCIFIHSPLFENIKKTSPFGEALVCTYACKDYKP